MISSVLFLADGDYMGSGLQLLFKLLNIHCTSVCVHDLFTIRKEMRWNNTVLSLGLVP